VPKTCDKRGKIGQLDKKSTERHTVISTMEPCVETEQTLTARAAQMDWQTRTLLQATPADFVRFWTVMLDRLWAPARWIKSAERFSVIFRFLSALLFVMLRITYNSNHGRVFAFA